MKFAIISPATEVNPLWIDGAITELRRRGHEVVAMPHAYGPSVGTFAASDAGRLEDLRGALLDPSVNVILCARGGYGCIHLLSPDLEELVRTHPKWLVGFSDISALHALWIKAGVRSLHASMGKQLTKYLPAAHSPETRALIASEGDSEKTSVRIRECADLMLEILEGRKETLIYEAPSPVGVIAGEAEGEIVGGNLAVLNGLASTPWDILDPAYLDGKILFLEDIGEKIYQVERMLTRLHLSGALHRVAGIVFGTFTDYRPDRNFPDMESMISMRLQQWGIRVPVALSFPVGHQGYNLPIPEGVKASLKVAADLTRLTLSF